MLAESGLSLIDKALATNPNLSVKTQEVLYYRRYFGASLDREDRVRLELCKNENLSERLFNEMSSSSAYHDELLCNRAISKYNYDKIIVGLGSSFWGIFGGFVSSEYYNNSGLPEKLQSLIIEKNKDNQYVLAQMASNPGLVPSQQTILSQNVDLDVLLKLIRNPASTSRTVETATQQIKHDASIKDKLTEKVKRAAAAFENKKVELAKQHELTRDGFIKNITTVNDIIENELVTSLKDELVWLSDLAKSLGIYIPDIHSLFSTFDSSLYENL